MTDADLWNSIMRLRPGGPTPRWVELGTDVATDSIDSDYNSFWHIEAGASKKYFDAGGARLTLLEWRATGRDLDRVDPLGSHGADPLFVDPQTNNYFTRPGWLARDGALDNAPGAPVCGARPDIGFLESCN